MAARTKARDAGPWATRAGAPVTQKQFNEMGLLLRVAREVGAHDTLDGMLRTIVEHSTRETNAERGTLFLHDEQTKELYSRVALGTSYREIRVLDNSGIAGAVFTSGQGEIVHDAYADPRFNTVIDQQTGFLTKDIACAPVKTVKGEVIGVLQVLNKKQGKFKESDLRLLEAMTTQTTATLRSLQVQERAVAQRSQEMRFLDLVSDVTADLDLSTMLVKVVNEAARMLEADRATLFINDEKTKELFSRVAMGASVGEIRMPNHVGIAGAVFTSGQAINIPYAYADLRFNPAFDKRTGYFTRSILCVPIANKTGKVIGAAQVLNKRGGPFTREDEARLRAFTAQLAISLENAKLFDDVQNIKNYNDSMLQSMSNGVVTLNEEGLIVTCNVAGLRILKATGPEILDRQAEDFFTGPNAWVLDRIKAVGKSLESDIVMDASLDIGGQKMSVNLTTLPLMSRDDQGSPKKLGSLLMLEDISSEKRMKSTMSRYMDPSLADQLLAGGEEVLGGKSITATVLFSDIRSFTSITEELGPQGTVSLLNEYFTIMVDCIRREGGMLDKFIGDAIMAVFGLPMGHDDDEDRAVRASIGMITELRRWNGQRLEDGKKPLDMGIGLNTDLVVSGNIGSPKRMDYTIIGDGVNLASRLESACKQYAARILVSENTVKRLRGTYRMREIDKVVVKGKNEPVGVYEVLDYHTEETFPNLMEAVSFFKGGVAYYRRAEWDKASAAFREALALNPQDTLAQIYVDRCASMKDHPPGDKWDGVYVMKSK
jgi:adenylate cyclase